MGDDLGSLRAPYARKSGSKSKSENFTGYSVKGHAVITQVIKGDVPLGCRSYSHKCSVIVLSERFMVGPYACKPPIRT